MIQLCLQQIQKLRFSQKLYRIVHSSVIYNIQKGETTQCPSTDECINKMWSIHTYNGILFAYKHELLLCAATWMNLENIMLHERNQAQRTHIV